MSQSALSYNVVELNQMVGSWMVASNEGQSLLENELLPKWLPSRRWFGGKARTIERISIEATVLWPDLPACVLVSVVHYTGHAPDRYLIPLAYGPTTDFDGDAGILARDGIGVVLSDALFNPAFRTNFLRMITSRSSVSSGENCVTGKRSNTHERILSDGPSDSRILGVEQSNTSILYGGRLFLKVFRRLEAGVNPDVEIMRFLSERQRFAHVPAYCGELNIRLGEKDYPMGLMLEAVENQDDAWSWALKVLKGYYVGEGSTTALERIRQLGEYTAEMHVALAADTEDSAFKPEPMSRSDFEQLAVGVTARLDALIPMLRNLLANGDSLVAEVLSRDAALRESIAQLRSLVADGAKTRHHGDYHLGQVLDTGSDWMIIDFEGEPTRPLVERREKRSPLRDVAGMLRSFHYAAHSACPVGDVDARKRAEEWSEAASSAFLEGYMAKAGAGSFLPANASDRTALLRAFLLEKALYEVDYELNNRPDWLPIPLRGVLHTVKNDLLPLRGGGG